MPLYGYDKLLHIDSHTISALLEVQACQANQYRPHNKHPAQLISLMDAIWIRIWFYQRYHLVCA